MNQRSGFVVDGHARVALALSRGEATVPVLYVDLEPEEEALVLATLDPISAMAGRPAKFELTGAIGEFGRGERTSADTIHLSVRIVGGGVISDVHRRSEIA